MEIAKMTSILAKFNILVLLFIVNVDASEIKPDPQGYISYCPCMGRFGNQADHLLGALAFAKALNRTLILPPWVEYREGSLTSIQVPFNKYFKVEPLLEYHRVILMEDFMNETAKLVWPLHKRISFCYMERKSLNPLNTRKDCNAKEGNPFGPFWDTFKINFIASEFFGPFHYDVHHSSIATNWKTKYSARDWPVIAFTGAPAAFPVQVENRKLHKYIQYNEKIEKKARVYIKNKLPKGAFIGVHLRNGMDWIKACEHVKSSNNLFASPQCLGFQNEHGKLYEALCMPPQKIIVKQLKTLIREMNAIYPTNPIKSIFVASDNNDMVAILNDKFDDIGISAHSRFGGDPHVDLAILGAANYFIGNCVSSFSAFVIREREVKGFPSYFWAFPREKYLKNADGKHDEL